MRYNLENTLPPMILIGPFYINTDPLRQFLIGKRQELATKLLIQFAFRMKMLIEEVLEDYKLLMNKLNEKPSSIEHIFDIKDWMETIPLTVRALEETTKRLLIEYEVLDAFWYALDQDDFENKWEVIGWPYRIFLQIEKTNEFLVEETDKFLKIQLNDELTLFDRIEVLSVQVAQMSARRDFHLIHDIAVDIRRMWKTMKEAQEFGQLLNQRQKLFGLPVVPFENLTRLIKEFEPYKNLWITASGTNHFSSLEIHFYLRFLRLSCLKSL